ncbi:GTP pyrophosphokinase [Brevibacterium aurantiacum]|uniref:GTP pyrophosphokinase n=1 Tax=Brevibacterium aurantiacum TaxID=273384 RepID=UPI0001BC2C83|nr:RelA/SpoT domain protein [Brevibacterium aurantiacum]
MTDRIPPSSMALTPGQVSSVRALRRDFSRLLMEHRFVIDELLTKISILDLDVIRTKITDIAGIRITCSFVADTYHVLDMLTSQNDVRVVEIKDYIAHPKPNGYKSLHAILEVPVFLSGGPTPVICEVQIRTIAMVFWASLEHKIHYKFAGEVPDRLVEELTQAAEVVGQLDRKMEQLHAEVHDGDPDGSASEDFDDEAMRTLWELSRREA